MEPTPQRRTTRFQSGIPRASRLPVSRNLFAPPSSLVNDREISMKEALSRDTESLKSRYGYHYSLGGNKAQMEDSKNATEPSRDLSSHNDKNIKVPEVEQSFDIESCTEDRGPELSQIQMQRRPRPSLSDRAIESLSQIPPSPSPRRRKSGFFPDQSPARTPSRQGPTSTPSRPNLTLGSPPPLPASSSRLRSIAKSNSPSKDGAESLAKSPQRRVVSSTSRAPSKNTPVSKSLVGSRTLAARSIRERPKIDSILSQKKSPGVNSQEEIKYARNSSPTDARSVKKFEPSRSPKRTVRPSAFTVAHSEQSSTTPANTDKSSAALREAIAKAKAAHIRQLRGDSQGTPRAVVNDNPKLLDKRLEMARTDGRLNISGLALREIPQKIISSYDRSALDFDDTAAFEAKALTKLAAADNDIENLSDEYFPQAHMRLCGVFAMLESLDFHGNRLTSLPAGLGDLRSLSVLNLSRNSLTNSCLEVINVIPSLRELHLASNKIEGVLGSHSFSMSLLDTLNLSDNTITELPPIFAAPSSLRRLYLAGNKISSLPFESMTESSLIELDISRNKVSGTLLSHGVSMPCLRVLDASSNALTKLCENENLHMPELQVLRIEENRLQAIPGLSQCIKLMALSAAANNIIDLPDGMTSLPVLANVDLSRNGLRRVDESIGLMESLSAFNVANNLIPQRRLMSMATDVLKKEMRERLDKA